MLDTLYHKARLCKYVWSIKLSTCHMYTLCVIFYSNNTKVTREQVDSHITPTVDMANSIDLPFDGKGKSTKMILVCRKITSPKLLFEARLVMYKVCYATLLVVRFSAYNCSNQTPFLVP